MDGTINTQSIRDIADQFRAQKRVLDQIRGNFQRAAGAGSAMADGKATAAYQSSFQNYSGGLDNIATSFDGYIKALDDAANAQAANEQNNGQVLTGGG